MLKRLADRFPKFPGLSAIQQRRYVTTGTCVNVTCISPELFSGDKQFTTARYQVFAKSSGWVSQSLPRSAWDGRISGIHRLDSITLLTGDRGFSRWEATRFHSQTLGSDSLTDRLL